MRAWRPDAALVLPPSFSSAWFAFRTGAGTRVGFGHEARSWLLTRALRRGARGDAHLSEEYLRLGATIGVDPPRATMVLVRAKDGYTADQLRDAVAAAYDAFRQQMIDEGTDVFPPPRDFGLSVKTWEQAQALGAEGFGAAVAAGDRGRRGRSNGNGGWN